ncbi:hypothetical protein H632_c3139p0, partial [Helicosporidium sp. ATCC 50920]
MVGASAAVLQSCSDCQEGAQILPYYLGGHTTSTVVQTANFALLNSTASTLPDGSFVAAFTVADPAPAGPGQRRSLRQAGTAGSLGAVPLIFAAGQVSGGGGLVYVQHTSLGSSTANLTSANSNLAVDSSGGSPSLVHAHAALMTVGWGVLLPLGAVVARGFRMTGTWWFTAHLALQVLGVLAGFAGIGIGYHLAGWHTTIPTVQVHRNIGTAAAACIGVQLLTAFVRPAKAPTKLRKAWELWHHWLGRAGVVVAIVNIYYGYLHVADLGVWPYAVYSAVLGCVVLLGLAREPAVWRTAGVGKGGEPGLGSDGGGAPHGALA